MALIIRQEAKLKESMFRPQVFNVRRAPACASAEQGHHGRAEIRVHQLSIARSTVYKILKTKPVCSFFIG
ncbi:hypothetical protein NDJ79_01150 [Escherichia coli]|nr:hypothetical protein [Escherichia coli]MCP8760154.1 hypothetical protein [Escherichia coli]